MNWMDQQVILVKIENKYIPTLTRIIEEEYNKGLQMVRERGLDYAIGAVLDLPIMADLIPVLSSIYANSGVRMARISYRETLRKYPLRREMKSGFMGISMQWLASVRNALLKYAFEFVSDISTTIREEMLKVFQKALEEGWGYDRIAKEMLYSGLGIKRARVRARVIARTEVHRGAMFGSLEGARSLPYVAQKEWLSGRDNRVRRVPRDKFDHRELSGQVRDLEEPFHNEEDIQFPGDPQASAGNTIQCRCVMNFIPKLVNGQIILR